MRTRQQLWAEKAYQQVESMKDKQGEADYQRVCKTFPALIHNCGLCQALAFAEAKEHREYLNALAAVLGTSKDNLAQQSRESHILEYQRLTQNALQASTWLKRYAEALLKGDE